MKVKAFTDKAGTVADCQCEWLQNAISGRFEWMPLEVVNWPEGATPQQQDAFILAMEEGEIQPLNS
jgi:hypothetical protein